MRKTLLAPALALLVAFTILAPSCGKRSRSARGAHRRGPMPTKTAPWIAITPYRITTSQRVPREQMSGGTFLCALATSPKADLVFLDTERSVLGLYTDSRGWNMDRRRGNWVAAIGWGHPNHAVHDECKTIDVTFSSPQIPRKGAKWLRVKGTLVLTVGLDKVTSTSDPIQLTPGSTIDAGLMNLKVWKDRATGRPHSMTIQGEGRAHLIASLRILSTDGEEITNHRHMHGFVHKDDMGRLDHTEVEWSLSIPPEVEEVLVEVTYWTRTEDVIVPFDFTVGLGLGNPDGSQEAGPAD